MKFHAFVAGAAFAALTSIAHAAVIERTFDVEASGFTLASGPSVPAAVDPVTLNFTLIWDPSTITAPTASGLTVNSFSLPFASVFASDAGGNIALGRNLANAGDCLVGGGNTYCLFMANSTGANPTAEFDQFTTSDGEWVAGVVTVTASAIGAVPEPSTWAMMLVGFGGLGWLAQRHRRPTRVA
jgi:PEP-CTERM motif